MDTTTLPLDHQIVKAVREHPGPAKIRVAPDVASYLYKGIEADNEPFDSPSVTRTPFEIAKDLAPGKWEVVAA